MAPRSEHCVLVPIHNEERHLPSLVASLRIHDLTGFDVVFVDNGSRDGSRAILTVCPEVRSGRWHVIDEPKIGKFHAVRRGTRYAADRLGSRFVAFVDVDSTLPDRRWMQVARSLVGVHGSEAGYVYSHYEYDGFDRLPVFLAAYRAYSDVVRFLCKTMGWFAHGSCTVHPIDLTAEYFARADVTTEMDLRQSLFALRAGRLPIFHATPIRASGRRVVISRENFEAWCFYDRDFYVRKDINAQVKIDLNRPGILNDLAPGRIEAFFARRACKLASRNAIPMAIYDARGDLCEGVAGLLSASGRRSLFSLRREARSNDAFLSDRFDALVRSIEHTSAGCELAETFEGFMREAHTATPRLAAAAGTAG